MKERALPKLRWAISDYLAWLRAHGEAVSVTGEPKTFVAEELHVAGNMGDAGGPDPLLRCDHADATDENISRCLALLKHSRSDLFEVVSRVPPDSLRWKPSGEPRSVGNTLRHIANVDLWYLSRIRAPHRVQPQPDIFDFIQSSRDVVRRVLPQLGQEQRRGVFYPRRQTNQVSVWTATKVLHRLVTHERQHTMYLKRILALPSSPIARNAHS